VSRDSVAKITSLASISDVGPYLTLSPSTTQSYAISANGIPAICAVVGLGGGSASSMKGAKSSEAATGSDGVSKEGTPFSGTAQQHRETRPKAMNATRSRCARKCTYVSRCRAVTDTLIYELMG